MFEEVKLNDTVLAYILRNNYDKDGVHFFTPNHYSQQLAFMKHPKGKKIEPHIHNRVKREVHYTQEVLFIKEGVLKVNFYTEEHFYIESRILKSGDVILLSGGGHGFEVIEPVSMIEVKQGPFLGEKDKMRFKPKSL